MARGFAGDLRLLILSSVLALVAIAAYYIFVHQSISQRRTEPVGGWKLGTAQDLELLDTPRCTIERKSAASLTSDEFEANYRYKRPILVTFPNGTAEWTRPDLFTRSSLSKRYGDWSISYGNSLEIVRQGGVGNVRSPFDDFVRKLDNATTRDEPIYVFDRNFYRDSGLAKTLRPPDFLRVSSDTGASFFFMGGSRSGVSFHKHADAWNGVVYGRKRWFLYPPETTPPGGVWPGFSQLEWFRKVYPQLDDAKLPLECIQEAGEILYLPESYYHGTLNIGDTLAVGWQKKEAVLPVERIIYDCTEMFNQLNGVSNNRERVVLYEKIAKKYGEMVEMLPSSSEAHHKFGEMLFESGKKDEGMSMIQKAIEIDPLFVIAYTTLAQYLIDVGNTDEAERLCRKAFDLNPMHVDVNLAFAHVTLERGDLKSALRLYKRAAVLNPSNPFCFEQMASIYEDLGYFSEAKRMMKKVDALRSEEDETD